MQHDDAQIGMPSADALIMRLHHFSATPYPYVMKDNGPVNAAHEWASTTPEPLPLPDTASLDDRIHSLVAAWIVYVDRLVGDGETQLGIKDCGQAAGPCPVVPMQVRLTPAAIFDEVRKAVAAERQQCVVFGHAFAEKRAQMTTNSTDPSVMTDLPWPLGCSFVRTHGDDLFAATCGAVLTLEVAADTGTFRWICDGLRVDIHDVTRMSGHLRHVLDAASAVNSADYQVATLPLMYPEERGDVLPGPSATSVSSEDTSCIHEVFEAQARKHPDRVAVIASGKQVTYKELDDSATALAARLIARGVGPGDRVVLCADRTVAMIIGLMGVWKSGAAYVPIDPAYPSARVATILEDCAPSAVLLDASGRQALGASVVPRDAIDLGEHDGSDKGAREGNAQMWQFVKESARELRDDQPAYIIYTSGTTGRPKGTVVEHRSAVNFWRAMCGSTHRPCPAHAIVALNASMAFDMSLKGILQLLSGHTVLLIPHRLKGTGTELLDFLAQHTVDAFDSTPTQIGMLIEAGLLELQTYRPVSVLLGGEAIGQALWQRLRSSEIAFFNMYGPTETTVDATIGRIRDLGTRPSIGWPVLNVSVYLLDRYGQPVPKGAPGEIHVGGRGVAQGYLGQPGLTAERFLPDPFSHVAGARMFRTGDRGRYLGDGSIEYLGRTDDQIKVNGFRIEPDDIQACLATHAAVAGSIVTTVKDDKGDDRLAAYVVLARDVGTPGLDRALRDALRDHVAAALPDYMVPGIFVALDALPQTANGKLDRRALPVPAMPVQRPYRSPQNPREAALCHLIAEVLGVPRVGTEDHFFEIGGQSLSAIRLIGRVRRELGLELSIRAIFLNPTVNALSRHMETSGAARAALQRMPRPSVIPLSHAQRRLWFLHRLQGPSATYNSPLTLSIEGELHVDALQAALQHMVDRHESLRTLFIDMDGQPGQWVIPPFEARVMLRWAEDLETFEQAVGYGFDLAREMPMRATLWRQASGRHVLMVLIHHIACDGASMLPIARELQAAYTAHVRGIECGLDALPVQYADYTLWQEQILGDAHDDASVLTSHLTYWRQALEGLPEQIALPWDRPRPATRDFQGRYLRFDIDASLHLQLHEVARSCGVTLSMLLQAALAALLSRTGAGNDIPLGCVTAGRDDDLLTDLVGFFANTWVLRVDTSGNPPFAQLLAQVRERALDAYTHQDAPFDRVVESLNPRRSMAYHPLFQVSLVLQHDVLPDISLPSLKITPLPLRTRNARFDLFFNLFETTTTDGTPAGIDAGIEYALDLFDPETVQQIAARFIRLLQAISSDASIPIDQIELLEADDRHRLLVDFNGPVVPFPGDACLHQLFEQQVARTPDAPALTFGDETLDYAELNRRANALACELAARGVGRDDRVGICAARSLDMVVGLIAILKAGAAYLPLDPDLPHARLAWIVGDAEPAWLLADKLGREALGPSLLTKATALEGTACPAAGRPMLQDPPARAVDDVDSRGLAYVIYTSGSTGTPKGVLNEHRGVVNRLHWMQRAYPLTSDDVVVQKTPFTFDVSVWEFFWPLLHGARLVVASPGGHRDPVYLADLIRKHGVTTLHFVPSMLSEFLDTRDATRCTSIKRVICSGEALPGATARKCQRVLAGATLHNLYGPTEAAIDVTAWDCPPDFSGDLVPIGKPIDNLRVYVLDGRHRLVPQGVVGELAIGGVGVARGYHNRPDLNAVRFLPDPFAESMDATDPRMYLTGDLARHRADGTIEFLGRNDFQVKVRGFRIEPGEIEATLQRHPAVSEAVVLARPDTSGGDQLVGYVTLSRTYLAPDGDVSMLGELQAHLRSSLPAYMVPAHLVVLENLPKTANGKLDRERLPAPMPSDDRGPHVAPVDAIEASLAALWRELLGVETVSRHDHFFDLGGHSLLAVRLMARLPGRMGIELPLATLFERPHLHELADAARAVMAIAPVRGAQGIPAAPRQGDLPASFAQQRMWFLAGIDVDLATYHMPLALHLRGELDRACFRASLDCLFARHETLRMYFRNVDGQPHIGLIDPAAGFPWQEHDLSGVRTAALDLERMRREDVDTPFALGSGPLLRSRLVRMGPNEHVFLLTQHHAISDEWSIGIFCRELGALYAAGVGKAVCGLPALPVQYVDYAIWQRAQLGGEALAAQAAWWVRELAGAPLLLDLPTDRSRPAHGSFSGGRLPVVIDGTLHAAVTALARRCHASRYMALFAAWGVVLGKLTGQQDVIVGTPVAGRTHPDTEAVIGCFVNTLAIRVNLADEPDALTLIARVRQSTLDAQEHQDVPFEAVVEAVQPPRSLSRTPLFQTILAWGTAEATPVTFAGLEVHSLPTRSPLIKFDLELHLHETEGRIEGELAYATELFDHATAERYLGYLMRTIEAMATSPDVPVAHAAPVGDAERSLLLDVWNAPTAHDPGTPGGVHARFERWAAATPDAIAVVDAATTLTYAALNAQANRLAHYLIEHGAGPETRVAVGLRRGVSLVVTLLAIWKAGAAYVPLDTASPPERLASILHNARPILLITDACSLEVVASAGAGNYRQIVLDATDAQWPHGPCHDPHVSGLCSQNLAYIIYTSGSTGLPKGVMIEHAQVDNLLDWGSQAFSREELEKTLFATPVHFDLSVFECFLPLVTGCTALVVENILELTRRQVAPTLINTVPSAILPLLDAGAIPASVRTMNLAGEPLKATLVKDIFSRSGVDRVNNLYGPSETTTYSTWLCMDRGTPVIESIGRPVGNTRTYVLDEAGRLTPRGSVGELYIGGLGVSRGYLGRADLTAERYLPDPYSDAAGARMYRTGDLARQLPDGNYIYLGRNDHQLKIRGHRVEPGDIETRLATHPTVREVVVIPRTSPSGDIRLVAYVTAAISTTPEAGTLSGFLSEHLPDYMVPREYVVLDALPLNRNGKVDRAALPEPAGDAFARARFEPPMGDIETALAALWVGLLDVTAVSRGDHFFRLGGHSLLAMRLLSRIQQQFGVTVGIRDLFEKPTLSGLADAVLLALVAEVT